MKKTNRNPIALNLPQVVGLLIVFGRHVVQKMTNNPWYVNVDPSLSSVTDHLDSLEKSEANAKGKGKGAAAARDVDLKVVLDDMYGLKAFAQGVVSQNPAQAAAIVESGGLSLKRFTKGQKAELAARMGAVPGEVVVRAKAVRRGAAYEWEYSSDGGATWIAMGTTTVANTILAGVKVGVTYAFRFRTTRKAATSDWSQIVTLFVH
jgi:hypothetical protein